MIPQTFIFFGPSGSGKGTQANLLQDKLKEIDPNREILYIETGKKIRELYSLNSFTGEEVRAIADGGGLLPEFIPIWIWTGAMIDGLTSDKHLFLDGVARRISEASVLDLALKFYKRKNPIVVSINVSDKWAIERLRRRGRSDDSEEEAKKRLAWYYENVVSVLDYFKNNPYYKFTEINGERSIEEVHQEILEKTLF